MINVHKKLNEAFSNLPLIENLQPNYKWGDDLHLNQLIVQYQKDKSKNFYPLLYNISNSAEQDNDREQAIYKPLKLVIATRNPHTERHNSQRWETTYKNILFPLAENIEKLFNKSQVFSWNGEFTLYEYPNYGNGEKNETDDIWDALRFDTNITITNNCFKNIFL